MAFFITTTKRYSHVQYSSPYKIIIRTNKKQEQFTFKTIICSQKHPGLNLQCSYLNDNCVYYCRIQTILYFGPFYPTYCTIVVHQRNERVEAGLAGFEMAPYIVSPVVKLDDKDECEEAETNDPGDSDTSEHCFAHFFSSDGKIKFLEATSTDLYQYCFAVRTNWNFELTPRGQFTCSKSNMLTVQRKHPRSC